MQVLLVSSRYWPEYSGSGFRAHNTYKRLFNKYSVNFDVVCNSELYRDNKEYLYDEVNVFRIGKSFKVPKHSLLRKFVHLINIVIQFYYSFLFICNNKKKYQLLHTFGNSWSVFFFTLYFGFKRLPIIRELCNEMETPLYPKGAQFLIKKIFKKSNTLFIAISPRLSELCGKFGLRNVWERPNPIVESKYNTHGKENKYEFRKKLTIFSKKDILMVHLAYFIPRKNHIFLLEVLPLLPEEYKLFLAGPVDGNNKEIFNNIEKKIIEKKLISRVQAEEGFILNFDEYIKMSDIFLFPTYNEGLGTPILEAQACGIPVVANYIKGITDIAIIQKKGGFISKLNPVEFADAIIKASNISWKELHKNSKLILKKASSKTIDRKYFEFIKKLINEI